MNQKGMNKEEYSDKGSKLISNGNSQYLCC